MNESFIYKRELFYMTSVLQELNRIEIAHRFVESYAKSYIVKISTTECYHFSFN